jgi:hypothetical protein
MALGVNKSIIRNAFVAVITDEMETRGISNIHHLSMSSLNESLVLAFENVNKKFGEERFELDCWEFEDTWDKCRQKGNSNRIPVINAKITYLDHNMTCMGMPTLLVLNTKIK